MKASRPPLSLTLERALGQLQQGRFADAEVLLETVLEAEPGNATAHSMLGFSRYRQQRLSEAADSLRRSLALVPRQPDTLMNLGYVLRGLGNDGEAAQCFRRALVLAPALEDAYMQLGDILHGTGALDDAQRCLRALLTRNPSYLAARVRLSAVLIELKQLADAEEVASHPVAAGQARNLLAALAQNRAIAQTGQNKPGPAAASYARAQEVDPALSYLDHRRACLLEAEGDFDAALVLYRKALGHSPCDLAVHRDYNHLLYRLKQDELYLGSFDEAYARNSTRHELLLEKARLLLCAREPVRALALYDRVLRVDPENMGALNGQAVAMVRMNRFDEALGRFETMISRAPENPSLYGEAAAILLQMHEPDRALEMSQAGLRRDPQDQTCLALVGTSYRVRGDAREEAHNGYQRLVQVIDLEPPAGFADMAEFNQQLDGYLDRLHPHLREFVDQSLRGGTQTVNHVFDAGHGLVDLLRQRIDQAITRYIADLSDVQHPFDNRRGTSFAYSGSWSSRLYDCGFHVNHLHTGWISACYYVAAPPESETSTQGWLKFGEPSYDVGLTLPPARMVQPVPGRLVLFPSYTWHGTEPFRSAASRTTVAFDAIPV
jgi:tetratricopeptide (TPR) repeat protein